MHCDKKEHEASDDKRTVPASQKQELHRKCLVRHEEEL